MKKATQAIKIRLTLAFQTLFKTGKRCFIGVVLPQKKKFDWKLLAVVVLAVVAVGEFAIILNQLVLPAFSQVKTIKVLGVGAFSEGLALMLEADDYRIAGIQLQAVLPDSKVTERDLNEADLVIMQGEVYCDNTLEIYVKEKKRIAAEWEKKRIGGIPPSRKFLIIGNACSRSAALTATGWRALVEEKIRREEIALPFVERVYVLADGPLEAKQIAGRLVIENTNHEIFNGIVNYNFDGNVFVFSKAPKFFVLASITDGNVTWEQVLEGNYTGIPAIAEISDGIYFAFDPSTGSRNLLLNTLLYLAKART